MRNYQNSRPVSITSRYTKALNRGNSIPVVAISPRGNTHIYPSISEFVRDVEGLDISQRRTATRRVSNGGGYVENWYVTDLRGYRG